LKGLGILVREDAVLQGLVGDPFLFELLLEVFVTVQTELRVIREIGTELQEEGPEVLIDAVEVVMVHWDAGLHDPGISGFCLRIAAFLGAINRAFFLRLANEYDALPLVEGFPLLFGEIVFPLSFGKSDQGNLVALGEALNRADEPAGDGLDHEGGGHLVPAMDANELQGALDVL
jgi:hypothetical protein